MDILFNQGRCMPNQYQLIPYKRTVELLEVFFGVRISEGAIAEWNKKNV